MEKAAWLSYDLGVRSDYISLHDRRPARGTAFHPESLADPAYGAGIAAELGIGLKDIAACGRVVTVR